MCCLDSTYITYGVVLFTDLVCEWVNERPCKGTFRSVTVSEKRYIHAVYLPLTILLSFHHHIMDSSSWRFALNSLLCFCVVGQDVFRLWRILYLIVIYPPSFQVTSSAYIHMPDVMVWITLMLCVRQLLTIQQLTLLLNLIIPLWRKNFSCFVFLGDEAFN